MLDYAGRSQYLPVRLRMNETLNLGDGRFFIHGGQIVL